MPRFAGPIHIVCEGEADVAFIEQLITFHSISGFEVSMCRSGKSTFQDHLIAQTVKTGFRDVAGIIMIRDGDDSIEKEMRAARKEFASIGYSLPNDIPGLHLAPPDRRVVGLYFMPYGSQVGTLEHLLLDAALETRPDFNNCVEAFVKCAPCNSGMTANSQAKMMLQMLIASSCPKHPSAPASRIWGKAGNPIPIESAAFFPLKDFLLDAVRLSLSDDAQ